MVASSVQPVAACECVGYECGDDPTGYNSGSSGPRIDVVGYNYVVPWCAIGVGDSYPVGWGDYMPYGYSAVG